ncbi:helix-turn-helix domain-containing protein [Streptomonospora sp. S1-112]|uniref:Helix-turn-helix domain-containing protein n=1 Tax=Streptomonospora mangrovi TaxID=2883123 RepID=A0A9X3NPT8_9ACTN|nr:helix-turn-helix transcriptional regulator [Streptomonospora mangrovi]MDA0566980.1 helix-turn-helix domain-containing protein [Streptomonospora mangrovi]
MAISPDSARRRFGAEVRKWRDHAGLTQLQLARLIPLSQSQVSGIELGQKGTTEEQIRRMDDVLTTEGALLRRWEALKRSDGYAVWFRDVVQIEKASTEIRVYQPMVVPGLLQTERHARVLIQQGKPAAARGWVDERVRARIDRQVILGEDGPLLTVVLEEHVLRRPLGGYEIMREQLGRLVQATASPRITIQIVPMAMDVHPGMDGGFQLFTVPDKGTVVYTETRSSGTPIDDEEIVADYQSVFAELRGVALHPAASRELMTSILEEYSNAAEGMAQK